jgi:hypothetical protein
MRPVVTARVYGAVLVLALVARPAAAQTASSPQISDVLSTLLTHGVTLGPPLSGPSHSAHFQPSPNLNDPSDVELAQLTTNLNRGLLDRLPAFPLGSSSGGFVFTGDPALGDFRPASRSFGPTFGERAFTSGKGNFNVGFTFQRASFDSFEGKNLDDGSIKFNLRHTDCCPPFDGNNGYPNPTFEADLVRMDLSLKLDTNTTAFLVNYGVTNRLDVGAALPIVHVSVSASAVAAIDRTATTNFAVHYFQGSGCPDTKPNPNCDQQTIAPVTGSATGIGDIVLRAKYQLLKTPGGGLAAGVDLRLPTGDETKLLGIGATQGKFLFIGSQEMGNFALHGNVSYAAAGTSSTIGDIPKEIGYNGGVEVIAGRATLAFDLLGRTLRNTVRFSDQTRQYPTDVFGDFATRTVFTPTSGNLTQVLGIGGVKVLVAPHLLLTGNVMFQLNDSGLKANYVPVVGFEYVFPRH